MLSSHIFLCTDKHSDLRRRQNDLPSADASFVLVESHSHRWSKQSLVKGSVQKQHNLIEWLSRFTVSQWVSLHKKRDHNRETSVMLAQIKCNIDNKYFYPAIHSGSQFNSFLKSHLELQEQQQILLCVLLFVLNKHNFVLIHGLVSNRFVSAFLCCYTDAAEIYKVNSQVSLSPPLTFILHPEMGGGRERGSRVHVLKNCFQQCCIPFHCLQETNNCFYGYSYFGNGLYGNSLIYLANTGLKLWGARSRCVCVCVCPFMSHRQHRGRGC